ncbi:radical SAM protein, partial [Candidatus Woesearchaeota archaeon]|nr:radical SAM protein [Candidatus Woesearchaeota archaeon]
MVKQFKKLDGDILLTTACPVDCDFCIYGCVHKGEWMPEETIERVAKEYTENDVGIRICGGEPFYDLGKLEKCIDIVLKYQQPHEVLLITSGFFGGNKKLTEKAIKLLVDKKLDTLLVSSDRFHLKRVPLSSLVNVIQEAKKQKLKIILRITTDEKSYELMDELAEIIVKHQIRFEPHEEFGVYGKAELLEKNLRDNRDKRKNYLNKKIIEAAEKQNKSTFLNHYIEISPKRSQKEFAARFYPTTFPNGNIYADSQCAKGSFMGNINENSLSDLIKKFSKTLPGHILLSKRSDCASRMKKLNPPNTDTCDYCRNQPLVENTQKEAIGRQLVILDS